MDISTKSDIIVKLSLFQRIKEHVKITAGLKMSEFHHGVYKNIRFETHPCGIRRCLILRKLPYWAGNKAKFKLKIYKNDETDNLLDKISVMKSYSSRSKSGSHLDNNSYSVNETCDEMIIESSTIYGSEPLEYWLGTPYVDGSEKIADLQGSRQDQFIWFTLVPGIVGFFISLFLVFTAYLLGFLEIIPHWKVFIK